jgi:hypothetical protein
MNIKNATTENIQGDRLISIFGRQKELMNKYHDIEKNIGLMQTEDCPVNLHDKRGQARLKDFAWRTTEEIAEAMETLPMIHELADKVAELRVSDFPGADSFAIKHEEIQKSIEDNMLHFQEELVDSLHFFTEFTILCGISPLEIWQLISNNEELEYKEDLLINIFSEAANKGHYPLDAAMAKFITDLGLCCNCLKNKAWKQSSMLTDIPKFKQCVANAWVSFMILMKAGQLNPDTITDLYLKKSQVNFFRQRSQY